MLIHFHLVQFPSDNPLYNRLLSILVLFHYFMFLFDTRCCWESLGAFPQSLCSCFCWMCLYKLRVESHSPGILSNPLECSGMSFCRTSLPERGEWTLIMLNPPLRGGTQRKYFITECETTHFLLSSNWPAVISLPLAVSFTELYTWTLDSVTFDLFYELANNHPSLGGFGVLTAENVSKDRD